MLKPGQTKNGHPRVWIIRHNEGPGAGSPAVAVLVFLRGATLDERVSTRDTVIAIRNSLKTGAGWRSERVLGDSIRDATAAAVRSLGDPTTSLLRYRVTQDRRVIGGLWVAPALTTDVDAIVDRIQDSAAEPALTLSPWYDGMLTLGEYVKPTPKPAEPQPTRVEPMKITAREIAVEIGRLTRLQARLRDYDDCRAACKRLSIPSKSAVGVSFNGCVAFTTTNELAMHFASEHLSMIEAELEAAGVALDDGDLL